MKNKFLLYLKVSRPGLWFATIWLYMLPTSQSPEMFHSFLFWYGFFYICFPLNFMVYGWNDVVDYETDVLNPRKDSFWFGARATKMQLGTLWKPIIISQILTLPVLIFYGGMNMLLIYAGFIVINLLYNLPEKGLRSMPPLELLCQIGYLLVVPFSIILNKTESLPFQTYIYLFLFSIQAHLMGEVMDCLPDKSSGRTTTTTVLGVIRTKILIILIVVGEIFIVFQYFKEVWFSAFLSMALLWLLLDLLFIFRKNTYTLIQMKIFAFISNLLALLSILYVWMSGCLLMVK
ncbi:MAG: UbiA family prenyltransferase [Saprospiraceae bacterium]|nr:UbiA family prenyltransferase [Saprospiraceae bacterium]